MDIETGSKPVCGSESTSRLPPLHDQAVVSLYFPCAQRSQQHRVSLLQCVLFPEPAHLGQFAGMPYSALIAGLGTREWRAAAHSSPSTDQGRTGAAYHRHTVFVLFTNVTGTVSTLARDQRLVFI